MSLDAVKARLYSISPRKMVTYSGAARKLLEEDMPRLLDILETANSLTYPCKENVGCEACENNRRVLAEKFRTLEASK